MRTSRAHARAGVDAVGAVLMEVILALILFVGAAAIVTGGVNASIKTLDRTRLNMHASNLAVSILAELQMGVRPAAASGPEPFGAPYEEWTWELTAEDVPAEEAPTASSAMTSPDAEASAMSAVKIEVVIRHGFESIVHRLVEVVPVVPLVEVEESISAEDDTGADFDAALDSELEFP